MNGIVLKWNGLPFSLAVACALFCSPATALLPLEGVTRVAAGWYHTCVIVQGGGVKCWGQNVLGQLGDGTIVNRPLAVDVPGLGAGVAAISAGPTHTCALTSGGGVKCWGANPDGQVGDGSTSNRSMPVGVSGLASGVSAISTGTSHGCALTSAGGVKCWGSNALGQVGDGSGTSRLAPANVAGLATGVAAIAAGSNHTCALTTAGAVKCWGNNAMGQLGDNTTVGRNAPVDVAGLSGVVAIAAGGNNTCALTTGGEMKCWGSNLNGQVGDNGPPIGRPAPASVLVSGVVAIGVGGEHACALVAAGGVKCWGLNIYGEVGDNSDPLRRIPGDVPGLGGGVVAIALGGFHTCAIVAGGRLKCWGQGFLDTPRSTPVNVTGLPGGVSAISGGGEHTCAIEAGGGAKCWGSDAFGQLGYDADLGLARRIPVPVAGLSSGIAAIEAGELHACALNSGGGVRCWGANSSGQLGDGSSTERQTPVDVVGLASGVMQLAAGWSHSCALTAGGGVKCWGSGFGGALGNNSNNDQATPVDVVGLASGVAAITAGGYHTCALTTGGGVKCWGSNHLGQVGDGSSDTRRAPVNVSGLASGVVAIAAGITHTCALTASGGVKCWGGNELAQLGYGSSLPANPVPGDVTGLAGGVVAIASGTGSHTCALTSAGGVKCWGFNQSGQLGDGSTTSRPEPVDVVGLQAGVASVNAGRDHTCAILAGGGARCWGANSNGQLGEGLSALVDSRIAGAAIVSGPPFYSNSSSASLGFTLAVPGAAECSLDGGAFVGCTSPQAYGGLASGGHTFRVRARDSGGNADPDPAARSWIVTSTLLTASDASIDFGAQLINSTSPARVLTLTNPTSQAIQGIVPQAGQPWYQVVASTCGLLAPGASCQVSVVFFPGAEGPLNGYLFVTHQDANGLQGILGVELAGAGERSFVSHYYRSILRREPDAGGRAFWAAEAARVQGLGASVNEAWFAMAQQFYSSAEYAAQNRDNSAFATDLYVTFFNRGPDPEGLAFWISNLAQGMPREVVLAQFMFSTEFRALSGATFGSSAARGEVDAVMDFYRGLLSRLPDDSGFNFWVGRFRAAQCQGQAAILAGVEAISSAFALSGEYSGRGRSNAQYVGDLYNAFLRRGGDLQGVQYWINQLASGVRTREQVRVEFRNSAEFGQRVTAIIQQGCIN